MRADMPHVVDLDSYVFTKKSSLLIFTVENKNQKLSQRVATSNLTNTVRVAVPAITVVVAVLAVVAGCALVVGAGTVAELCRSTVGKERSTVVPVVGALREGNTVVPLRVVRGATVVVDPCVLLDVGAVEDCGAAEASVRDVVCVAGCMEVDGTFVFDEALVILVVVVLTPSDMRNTNVTLGGVVRKYGGCLLHSVSVGCK